VNIPASALKPLWSHEQVSRGAEAVFEPFCLKISGSRSKPDNEVTGEVNFVWLSLKLFRCLKN